MYRYRSGAPDEPVVRPADPAVRKAISLAIDRNDSSVLDFFVVVDFFDETFAPKSVTQSVGLAQGA